MRGDAHVRCGGRAGGTGRERSRNRAPARPLHHRAEQLRDRRAGRAHHPVHDAAAPAPHGRPRPRGQERPALAGHGAEAVRDAIAATIITLPEQLRRSLTWDRGKEMAQHAQLPSTPASDLLLRPAQPLAARHQREHQRPAAPVLPQGHRPGPLGPPKNSTPSPPRSTAGHARHSAGRHQPKHSMNSYSRSTSRCCDDRLNPPSTP